VTDVRPRVVMVAPWLPQYRVSFYEGVRSELERRGIDFALRHGVAPTKFAARGDAASLPWADPFVQRRLRVGPTELESTPWIRRGEADLVVLDHLAKQPVTYLQLGLGRLGLGPRTALFGHGSVGRTQILAIGRFAKQRIARLAWWWFVYTEAGARDLRSYGVPEERTTVLYNTLDTSDLRAGVPAEPAEAADLRHRLGLGEGPVALHIGGLDASKRPDLLIETGRLIAARRPDFRLLVAGAGSGAPLVEEAARRHDWLVYLGPVFGSERVDVFAVAELLLHPGKVGLVAVDSFAAGRPLVTAAGQLQAPEFDYLDPDNAVIVPAPDACELAEATLALLADPCRLRRLRAACRATASRYSVDDMAARMADGVERALDRLR
jgi:glycosyltransferase involved in cell wall biosynthesis